jgi:hypothetical protein
LPVASSRALRFTGALRLISYAFLLQDYHELEARKSAAHLYGGEIAIQPSEDAGVVAGDEEDLVALQIEVAIQGFYQHLHGGDEDVEGLFSQ